MSFNILQKYYQAEPGPGSALGGAIGAAGASMNPLGLALTGAQAAFGIIQTVTNANRAKKLLQQRTAYKTPEEYYKILNATQSLASQGYDPFTLNFLTGNVDRAFDSTLGAATRLGADPNQLSALFDQKIQSMMKIGADNHMLNMENFSKYLSALDVIGQNKTAEWKSREDILKDKLQAASGEKAAGIQNIGSAINALLGLDSARRTSNLYTQ